MITSKIKSSNDKIGVAGSPITLVGNVLYYHEHHTSVKLSNNQTMLFNCLLSGKGRKEQIIKLIWGGRGSEINYGKLISQTREKLKKANFPRNMILTIPKIGICLNMEPTVSVGMLRHDIVELYIDARVMNYFHM